MTITEIKKLLNNSRSNGVYIELPHFSSNERIYLHKSGKMFWVRRSTVEPTVLDSEEEKDTNWYFRDFGEMKGRNTIRLT